MENPTQLQMEPQAISPWKDIWLRPRAVIRSYLDSNDPLKNAIWIALAGGYVGALNQASYRNMGDELSLLSILMAAVVSGAIGGLLTLYFLSWFLGLVGRWLQGQGTSHDLRVAVTRGYHAPLILLGLLWIPELLLFGHGMFTSDTSIIESSMLFTVLFLVFVVLEVILGVWIFILFLKSVGEAHEFSAWRALGTVVLAFVIIVFLIVILSLLFIAIL
jgi:hypothetical protein